MTSDQVKYLMWYLDHDIHHYSKTPIGDVCALIWGPSYGPLGSTKLPKVWHGIFRAALCLPV